MCFPSPKARNLDSKLAGAEYRRALIQRNSNAAWFHVSEVGAANRWRFCGFCHARFLLISVWILSLFVTLCHVLMFSQWTEYLEVAGILRVASSGFLGCPNVEHEN